MGPNAYRDPARLERTIVTWLRARAEEAGMSGGIVGLSGGIDSAVVAALLQKAFGASMLTVVMPCHSDPQDEADARSVAEAMHLPLMRVDLTAAHDAFLAALPVEAANLSRLAAANIRPRLRMLTLYALAQDRRFLVCGTGNKVELTVGYFTKYGDSGVDLLPIGDLLKGEVRMLAAHLGVPRSVIDKPPTAGLWPGQTDEGEMGFTYAALDGLLATGNGDDDVRRFVDHASKRSGHKRRVPPICEIEEI